VRGRLTIGLVATAVAWLCAVPGAALAAPHRTLNITQANTSASPVTWDGTVHDGANGNYDSATGGPCSDDTTTYCDDTLLNVNVPAGFRGGVQADINNYRPFAASDFDLYVYESDAAGHALKLVANDGTFGVVLSGNGLPNGLPESYAFAAQSGYYLVRVVYFDVAVASQYSGSLQMNAAPGRLDHPQNVDTPPGLQDHLASNPALGFRSHSEPHIAQSPTNPDILVAGSKQYYRDRDSLKEYEFKIGSYVSFDRGITWTDLGQIDVCPPAKAPPDTYPDRNTCYPDENPNLGGTGPEDVQSSPTDTQYDNRGSGDLAEEYTTSDVWTQFDDEGNAYVMVLDSPPFPITDPAPVGSLVTEGNGWGMTMHKWDTVSPEDLKTGKTWGPRVPINFYADQVRERVFLDDKNTMAVNNAGPDNDGKPGIIITCWGRSLQPSKQEIVCERSTDGGKSFPGEPIPVSDPQNLVIGVDVVPDPKDENTFYLMWNHYVATTSPLNEMFFSKTTDGGLTWTPATPATLPFTPLPGTYPGQNFRQLSIPIIVAAPNGDLYGTYADYRSAPDAASDEDGMQADIEFIKSTDGGLTWSQPTVVNQDKSNADQFQPYIAVTPQGEIAINYFDRRNDKQIKSGGQVTHTGNYFVDEYLSRSTDGGATWKDTRLSHDMSNPEHNNPVDSAGRLFFGDYQGLVADDCYATPFMQDAHLSEAATRDPGFDQGFQRSDYQEVFSWQVPNLKQAASCNTEKVTPPVNAEGLPRVTVTAPRLASDVSTSSRFDVRINASAANIASYQLQYQRPTSKGWRKLGPSKLLSATYSFHGAQSATYRFRARAIAIGGAAGPWSNEAITVVPHDDRKSQGRPRYTGSWKRVKSGQAFQKSLVQTSSKGSTLRINFHGNRVYLVGRTGPNGGRAVAILNGRRKLISFYSAKTRNRAVVYSASMSAVTGSTLQVIALGQRGSKKSKGNLVEIDAVGYRK
jgi:hypothetical protein